jgi:hypothetical protein
VQCCPFLFSMGLMGSREKQLGPNRGKSDIGTQGIVEPSADIIASGAAPMNDLVMAAAPAEIAGPTAATGFLPVDMTFLEPTLLPFPVDATADMSHGPGAVVDEAMTRKQPPGC